LARLVWFTTPLWGVAVGSSGVLPDGPFAYLVLAVMFGGVFGLGWGEGLLLACPRCGSKWNRWRDDRCSECKIAVGTPKEEFPLPLVVR
jgi:hypothetical protein